MKRQPRLMIPGPIDLTDEVLEALRQPVIRHYGDEWVQLYKPLRANLLAIAESKGDAFVLVGTGTVGIDAAIGTSVATGEQLIVVDNGYFSGRMREVADGYGIHTHVLRTQRGEPVTPDQLSAALRQHPAAVAVALSHSETATGVLNDVEALAAVAADAGKFFIVDAVSSFGAARIAVDAWGIGICCAASQKALEGPPGVAPVIVPERSWTFLDAKGALHHGMYSDLRVWRKYAHEWATWHPQPATMAVNIAQALKTSTDGLLAEGLSPRYARYRQIGQRVRDRLRALGYRPLADDTWASPTVTAAYPADGVTADEVVAAVLERVNIQIGGGVGDLRGNTFRLGHMGLSTTDAYLDDVFGVLEELPRRASVSVRRSAP